MRVQGQATRGFELVLALVLEVAYGGVGLLVRDDDEKPSSSPTPDSSNRLGRNPKNPLSPATVFFGIGLSASLQSQRDFLRARSLYIGVLEATSMTYQEALSDILSA